jgi:hypothetical protein
MSQQLGDPDRYAQFFDQLVPEARLAAIAEIEQAVEHWRAAAVEDRLAALEAAIQALRKVV